jgi:hypothetical protein
MRASANDNLTNRIRWLQQILDSEISLESNEMAALANMRSFCALSKKGWFQKTSYNALKKLATNFSPFETHIPDITDHWEYMLDLRLQANDKVSNLTRLSGKEQLPNHKDLAAKSLMEAHLCAMAYFEMFRFLQSMTSKQGLNEEIKLLINNQLLISTEKFKIITSFADIETDRTKLKLIQGGKKE